MSFQGENCKGHGKILLESCPVIKYKHPWELAFLSIQIFHTGLANVWQKAWNSGQNREIGVADDWNEETAQSAG